MKHVLISGGTIVAGENVFVGDVLVEGERIAAVGTGLDDLAAQVVDATGLVVLPGLIDGHVHLREPGATHKEDWYTGTCAALAGGVTTVLAMPNTNPPLTDAVTLAHTLALAEKRAVCDFGLWLGATPGNADTAPHVAGVVGLKLYMSSATGDLLVADPARQHIHFSRYPRHRLLAVHAEDEGAVRYFATQGQRHPPLCAALAVTRALVLAEALNRRLHVCHVSTAQELAFICMAKARGVSVTCEVTPHHLFLTKEDETRLGSLAMMNPPLRTRQDVAALWASLGTVDAIASDHAPHTLAEKRSPDPPPGVPGLETTLPLLLDAVNDGRLTLPEVVRLTASGPARVFGLADKGHIAPGYDADLTLVRLEAEHTLDEPWFTRCGWSPFAGRRVRGRVERVWLRGREVFAGGQVVAAPGSGRHCCGPTTRSSRR